MWILYVVKQKDNTWGSVEKDMRRHMTSLNHDDLTWMMPGVLYWQLFHDDKM